MKKKDDIQHIQIPLDAVEMIKLVNGLNLMLSICEHDESRSVVGKVMGHTDSLMDKETKERFGGSHDHYYDALEVAGKFIVDLSKMLLRAGAPVAANWDGKDVF